LYDGCLIKLLHFFISFLYPIPGLLNEYFRREEKLITGSTVYSSHSSLWAFSSAAGKIRDEEMANIVVVFLISIGLNGFVVTELRNTLNVDQRLS
jgi:hypothetical protein